MPGYGVALGDRDLIPGRVKRGDFPLRRRVQNSAETHPASNPMGAGGSFPGSKPAGA